MSGVIDLGAVVRGEVKVLRDQLREDLREVLKEELAAREADRYLDAGALAKLLGISTKALSMRLRRGSKLADVAEKLDGRRVWKRSVVEALVAGGVK